MKKQKIGTIFLVSILALAGIGISYAGLTDTIHVFGTIQTAKVDLQIESYSGTYVWKTAPHGVYISDDPGFTPPNPIERVAYAEGRAFDDTIDDPEIDKPYEATIVFDNLFPCIDFEADIVFHYVGIPAKVTDVDWYWEGDMVDTDGDGTPDIDFIDYLEQLAVDTGGQYGMTGGLYRCDQNGELLDPQEEVVVGTQLHECHYFKLLVKIHLPQENFLQGLTGWGYVDIGVLQWTDECDEEDEYPDIEITKTVDDSTPAPGDTITFTVTATNLGPGDATSVKVEDILPDELVLNSATPSKGSYDTNTGIWDIGSIAAYASETLDLVVTVDIPQATQDGFTQFALIIDGSASIEPDDWNIMREGIATALTDPECFPQSGTVELTVIQFGTDLFCAEVVVPPTVITSDNVDEIAAEIESVAQGKGWTPMGAGIYLAANQMHSSVNFDPMHRQVINLVTDGIPNVVSEPDDLCGTEAAPEAEGKTCAETARDYLLDLLGMTIDQDEFDAEAVGTGTDVSWLRDNIVWPTPGYDDWPPTGPGWVRYVDNYTAFADTICEKFSLLFENPENTASLYECIPDDQNSENNEDKVTIYPQMAS